MHSLLKNVPHHVRVLRSSLKLLILARQEERVRAAMPPPPAAALPPPHHRTVRRTTVVAAPVRLPSPVRPRRTSWRLPSRGDIIESAKAPPHGTRRSGALMSSSPPSSPHPSAAVARPSPVRPPSTVMAALSFRDTMDPDSWSIAPWNGTSPVARIVAPPHTSSASPHPSRRRRRRRRCTTLPKTRTFYTASNHLLFPTLRRCSLLVKSSKISEMKTVPKR